MSNEPNITAIGIISKEQIDAELQKGFYDIKAGRVIPADEVESEMKRIYSI